MNLYEDRDYYITLNTRFLKAERVLHSKTSYARARIIHYIDRLNAAIESHADFDDNDLQEVMKEEREQSYEDWLELFAPVEHPGDSWKDNEDL